MAKKEQTRKGSIRHNLVRLLTKLLTWIGAALIYYVIFSLLFDTPAEYNLRHSTDRLREEYEALEARYDTLSSVLNNVAERDRNIFNILFEAEPYDLRSDYEIRRLELHEELLEQSSGKLKKKMNEAVGNLEQTFAKLQQSNTELHAALDSIGERRHNIPSIQPVTNHQLTLLTGGYGMLMHPFYKTLQSHQGVDYTIPEGTRIFATADGIVKDVTGKSSTSGITVVIDHRNGYTTYYSHLESAKVKRGQNVKRGDIIALSGNSGLSLSPHLHYEVRYEGMRVDPIHYFFMELTADEYRQIIKIARSGMQSFD